jgi:septal ring factor EnvC (AmiA/AmiB activator)
MKTRQRCATVCVLALSGLLASAARGERAAPGAGIGVDVEIARVLDEIETESAKQVRLDAELAVLDARRSQLHSTLKTRVRALYRITRNGMTPVAGGFEAIRQHVARVRRLTALVTNDARAFSVTEARTQAAHAETALAATSLGHSRERLAALQSQETMSSLHAREAAPGQGGVEPTSGGSFYGLRFSDANANVRSSPNPSTGFEALRGKLAAPVTGEVRVVDARRRESEGDGLEFQANPGTPVRAAAAGRVAFCDHYGSYGRLVILDHGAGYYTAYGGLGNVEVRVGDDLSPYARIGDIANDARPGLFFEVRKGTRALPPRAWLGL